MCSGEAKRAQFQRIDESVADRFVLARRRRPRVLASGSASACRAPIYRTRLLFRDQVVHLRRYTANELAFLPWWLRHFLESNVGFGLLLRIATIRNMNVHQFAYQLIIGFHLLFLRVGVHATSPSTGHGSIFDLMAAKIVLRLPGIRRHELVGGVVQDLRGLLDLEPRLADCIAILSGMALVLQRVLPRGDLDVLAV